MRSSGILLIDKPSGVTSRYVDNRIQKAFHTRHVGHLGTLDPFATGLLLVAVGSATKCLPYLQDESKTYLASLLLGNATSTGDPEGEVIQTLPVPPTTDAKILEIFKSFLGDSFQIPPMTSAIKVKGEALYKAARRGEEIERNPRPIHIDSLRMLVRLGRKIDFTCTVSKGTYIRVLGEDIAKKLGTVGHLTSLRRLAIGSVDLEKAIPLEEASSKDLLNPLDFLRHYPVIEVSSDQEKKIRNGVSFSLEENSPRVVFALENEALAIYERREDGLYHCLRGLF